jgi:hypothetical protein
LTASTRTVARPKPGSSVHTTSSGARFVAASIAATARSVGATSGKPSDQPRLMKSAFMVASAASRSSPSYPSRSSAAAACLTAGCSTGRVRALTTCSNASSAIAWTASGRWFVNGRGTTAMGRPGSPKVAALRSASCTNVFDVNSTVGTPRRSSSTMSWIPHDVQDPQSAVVPTTALTSEAMRSASSAVA